MRENTKSVKKFNNAHLPFPSNRTQADLKIWRDSVIPAVVDWAGSLDEPFGANAHPDFKSVVTESWNESFPELEINEAVYYVVSILIFVNLLIYLYLNVGWSCSEELAQRDWQRRTQGSTNYLQQGQGLGFCNIRDDRISKALHS